MRRGSYAHLALGPGTAVHPVHVALSICPGCGLAAEPGGIPLDRPMNASPECWATHAELVGFELMHPILVGRCHQLTVDAYGAQHAGEPTGRIRVAYSLVGLHLALDRGWTGDRVRGFHQRMGRPDAWWPPFRRPVADGEPLGTFTVEDVVRLGASVDSVDGHTEATSRWAADVWAAWTPQHTEVATLTDALLARFGEGSRAG